MSVQHNASRRAQETIFLLSLVPVRNSLRHWRSLFCGIAAVFLVLGTLVAAPLLQQDSQQSQPPVAAAPQPSGAPQTSTPAPLPSGPIVVINPAHGGTDTGARGEGAIEKDLVLQFARALRAELDRQGFRAVLTRNDDSNPSYDDRDGTANAYRDAIFISLHISSTGTFGAVRAYYNQMDSDAANSQASDAPPGFVTWREAQRPYLGASHRLAALIQIQCVQGFPGSPSEPQQSPIRELRSVEGPAVAVELSSVSGGNADALLAKSPSLAAAIGRGVQAFHAEAGK